MVLSLLDIEVLALNSFLDDDTNVLQVELSVLVNVQLVETLLERSLTEWDARMLLLKDLLCPKAYVRFCENLARPSLRSLHTFEHQGRNIVDALIVKGQIALWQRLKVWPCRLSPSEEFRVTPLRDLLLFLETKLFLHLVNLYKF